MLSISQAESYLALPQVIAFLDTIAWAEGGAYNRLYGGGTFSSFAWHPSVAITAGSYTSTAAGRYQFLKDTWNGIANGMGLPDFTPHNQDLAAIELIRQRGALGYVQNGDLVGALQQLGNGCAWAALPYAGCNQREKGLQNTIDYYNSRLNSYGGVNNNNVSVDNADNSQSQQADDNSLLYIGLGIAALFILT
jgi:muramidase (phage lysozyme)